MDRREAGRLGWEKGKEKRAENQRIFLENYNSNPKKCRFCEQIISFEKRANDFCSRSCAACYHNGTKTKIEEHPCACCGKEIKLRTNRKFCSTNCVGKFKREQLFEKIRKGEYKLSSSGNPVLRNFLIQERGFGCEECGLKEWRNKPIPLNVHHIDGDASNNKPNNMQLCCLNCHGLTENFGAKNRKSARTKRYLPS